ncbi:MAG TPA: LysR substrate-binding domain-containing protein [Woeseiaceae bacterium]|nr:LysR substrate-binding domain-containing protein [Woeseiaceae bacterium]
MQNDRIGIPPLNGLRAFVAVSRRMSITGAAADLFLTQSAVSRQIQQLEKALGVRLFQRHHRRLSLTPAGQEFLDLVEPFTVKASRFCARHRNLPSRTVTITATIGVTGLWLLPRIGRFQEAHPSIDIRLAANNRLVDLAAEQVDLAIRYCRASGAPAGAARLFGERIVPVAHPALAEHLSTEPASLLTGTLLEFDDREKPWLTWSQWLDAMELTGRRPKGFLRINQYDQVIEAALQGQGVALGRLPLIKTLVESNRLVAVPACSPRESDFAYWLIGNPSAGEDAARFAAWLRAEGCTTEDPPPIGRSFHHPENDESSASGLGIN